jgi:2-dehydro-3-deoxy-L-rhamnonate dehydrogenase (NAD+)
VRGPCADLRWRDQVEAAYDFSGRTAVVTGGAGGIGRAIVARLASAGASVWVWDLAAGDGSAGTCLQVDLTDPAQVEAATKRVVTEAGRIDVLVNSAGTLGSYIPFDQLAHHEWRRIIDVNVASVLEVCSHVVPHMRAERRGRIVNIGSLAAKQGLAHLAAYSAASGGVVAFTKALAQEVVEFGVQVNCVAPGPIDTTLITDLGRDVVESMIKSSPMNRLGTPSEVAEVVVWLCSDACTFATGAVFDVSGGRAAY